MYKCDECRFNIKNQCILRYGISCDNIKMTDNCAKCEEDNNISLKLKESDITYDELLDVIEYLNLSRDDIYLDEDLASLSTAIIDLKRTINELVKEIYNEKTNRE